MKIQLENLHSSYQGRNVLRDVSASFLPQLHFLIGLNGSGKTTLLHCIAGLQPFEGTLWIGDNKLNSLTPLEKARQVALVPQQLSLSFPLRIFDFVLNGRFPHLSWWGQYNKTDLEVARQSLNQVGMYGFRDRFVREISGGELQKVLLARALCQSTPILLLDEPAQSLDPKNRAWLYAFLHVLSTSGKTIICTTHDLEALAQPEARILALKEGAIVFDQQGNPPSHQWLMENVYS